MGLLQGLAGNLTEMPKEELEKKYGLYLIEGEEIEIGYKLVRDVIIFTNIRILDFDSQGATGKKTRAESIHLNTIFHVTAETAGFGIDDSEITVSYITSPYFRANSITTNSKKFEFPKKYDISPLYRKLEMISIENMDRINGIG
ncbi:PH domain-containing protein [Vallitalea guaymasensis]|uniref:PH domain-containing protein n=1 Tax=Vallitalea guaymasensis TaxID=1185412 RepID=A0A8J8SAQ5_9FIRM|nr:PH domain-containing protein [Vallitalea guaymasensis]QUH27610.1 PH domain-containing protein [Vallitalea guaymasensis]